MWYENSKLKRLKTITFIYNWDKMFATIDSDGNNLTALQVPSYSESEVHLPTTI